MVRASLLLLLEFIGLCICVIADFVFLVFFFFTTCFCDLFIAAACAIYRFCCESRLSIYYCLLLSATEYPFCLSHLSLPLVRRIFVLIVYFHIFVLCLSCFFFVSFFWCGILPSAACIIFGTYDSCCCLLAIVLVSTFSVACTYLSCYYYLTI